MSDLQVSILLTAKDHATRVIRELGPTATQAARLAKRAFKGVSRAAVSMAQRAGAAFKAMGAMAAKAVTGLPLIIAGALTAAGAMIGRGMIDAASDAEEIGGKFDVLFESVAVSANMMADDIALGLGRSKTDFRDYMATVQNLLTPMGLVGEAGLDLSASISTLAVDLASFNNATDDEALLALRSALTGETEPLRRFGVMLNEAKVKQEAARLGLVDLNGELTDQAKLLARVSIIQKETSTAQGDAVRTADSYANSMKALRSQVKDLSVEFGAVLITEIQNTIASLGGAERMSDLVRLGFEFVVQAGTGVIRTFGNVAKFALQVVDNLGGVSEATDQMGNSVIFVGNVFKTVWNTLRIVFLGFTNGLRTIIFAVKALWEILRILTALMGIGFLQALRATLFVTIKLVEGFDALTASIKDGLIFVLDKALEMLSKFVGAAAAFFDMIPGYGKLATAAKKAAAGISLIGVGLDKFKGRSEGLGALTSSLGDADAAIRETQANLSGFVSNTWSGLSSDAMEWAEEVASTGPVMAKAWETYLEGAQALRDSGGGMSEAIQSINAAIEQAMLDGALETGKGVGGKTAEGIAAGIAAQKQALTDALQGALDASGSESSEIGQGALKPKGKSGPSSVFGAMKEGLLAVGEAAGVAGEGVTNYKLITEATFGVGKAFFDSIGDFADAAVDSTRSIGDAWNNLKKNVVSAIAQMIAKMLAMKAIQFLFGGGGPAPDTGGGVAGNVFAMGGTSPSVVAGVPFKAFAEGGVVTGPTLALMGENPAYMGEAFIPIPSGGKIPVEGMGGGNVTFNITTPNAAGFRDMILEQRDTLVGMMQDATIRDRSLRNALGDI